MKDVRTENAEFVWNSTSEISAVGECGKYELLEFTASQIYWQNAVLYI